MTTPTTTPRITSPDNGYFEIWTLPCGHTVREQTEDTQWNRRNRAWRATAERRTAERLATRPCAQCQAAQ